MVIIKNQFTRMIPKKYILLNLKAESIEYNIDEEEFDKKLKFTLNKNNKKINLKRITKGIYEFGAHKLRLVLENEIFKGL